jgi:CHAT domain-containing protein/tetratricopeptide (TPR) repeat protein
MKQSELVAALAAADPKRRAQLLAEHQTFLTPDLAYALKSLFYETRISDPERAHRVSDALQGLADFTRHPEITALACWMGGIAALEIDGQTEAALAQLNEAAWRFEALGQPLAAASTCTSKLRALAMLGRYDEALECGKRARDVLLAEGDTLAAGKIEHNLGNIYFRRDRYQEAEGFYRAARARFAEVDDQNQLLLIDTSLAMTLINQHRFRDAETLCRQALARAEATGQVLAQAAIECDLGCLALLRGRYNQALDLLEQSRRRYAALGLTHESAIADLELANAYLELNLAPEAAALYGKTIPTFVGLNMQAEAAHAFTYKARAHLLLGQLKEAANNLVQARQLYALEGNAIGLAMVDFAEAQIHFVEGRYADCATAAAQSEQPFMGVGAWERALLARWLCGEAARAQHQESRARQLFDSILQEAEVRELPQIAQRCYTSLGFLEAAAHNQVGAEAAFKRAVELIEDLRALLPSDEFRTAFVSDKLIPYRKLVELCLEQGGRIAEALQYVEHSRSRALADMLSGALEFRTKPRDHFEAGLLEKLEELREELNWFYRQLNRPPESPAEAHAQMLATLYEAIHQRENRLLETLRQLQQCNDGAVVRLEPFDLTGFQAQLDRQTVVVEYFTLEDELVAFLITRDDLQIVRQLGSEKEIGVFLDRLRFQINSLRYGAARLLPHLEQLCKRTRHYLGALYDALLRPLEAKLADHRLVVLPHRALHYVPFHALYDGDRYVIERREVCYAPSASVLGHCLAASAKGFHKACLFGVADEQAPKVRDEVLALARLFPQASVFLDDQATLQALKASAAPAEVLHLACHGQFRSDNPLFSSLKLSDGYFTVRDAYDLDLHCGLLTLSACETGLNAVATGDELIGLARGFFSAGAPSLLLTLWTVDDQATADLMKLFYERLLTGASPAAALRFAQCAMIQVAPHPFFWSPFVLFGRW